MKKWLIGFMFFLLLLIACLYIFIPSTLSFQKDIIVPVNSQSFYRTFRDAPKWEKWWPGRTEITKFAPERFYFNGYIYTITKKQMSSIGISITDKATSASTLLSFIAPQQNAMHLTWVGNLTNSFMPFKRLQNYFKFKKLSNDLSTILKKIESFYANQSNVYGTAISQAFVSDSILVSTYANSKDYPTTEFIYEQIDVLKKYIVDQGAKETGFPMLNITTSDSKPYLTKVAIPVDRRLPSSGNISFRWMLGGGKILVTEVKGGPSCIRNAFKEMENYINDHGRVTPAIPFQSLITDRLKDPDTSKWVTKIFYPVM